MLYPVYLTKNQARAVLEAIARSRAGTKVQWLRWMDEAAHKTARAANLECGCERCLRDYRRAVESSEPEQHQNT